MDKELHGRLGMRHRGKKPARLARFLGFRAGRFAAAASILAMLSTAPAHAVDASDSAESAEVISNYLAATQSAKNQLRNVSMEVNIDASIPKLKKEGRLHALRKISQLGKITYKVLGFQGDDTIIKNEVIARYLEAEQKAQDNEKLAISPENYKFKFRGLHRLQNGQNIYIVFLTPRKKEVGLFKGEMWLDAKTYLPVMESGKFVKSPSVFFKKVEFVRSFAINDGTSVPTDMESTIDARLVGKVNLSVTYSGVHSGSVEATQEDEPAKPANSSTPSTAATTIK